MGFLSLALFVIMLSLAFLVISPSGWVASPTLDHFHNLCTSKVINDFFLGFYVFKLWVSEWASEYVYFLPFWSSIPVHGHGWHQTHHTSQSSECCDYTCNHVSIPSCFSSYKLHDNLLLISASKVHILKHNLYKFFSLCIYKKDSSSQESTIFDELWCANYFSEVRMWELSFWDGDML